VPLAAFLLENKAEVITYINSIQGKFIPMDVHMIPQPDNKALLIIMFDIMGVYKWNWANPLIRYMVKKGLKSKGYSQTNSIMSIKGYNLTKLLLANHN
jgi:hypothetical protein